MPTTFTASIQKILCTPQPVPSSEIAARAYPALEAISDAKNGAAQREPVIFCHHQHAGEFDIGKSEVVGLRRSEPGACRRTRQAGYVTISPDAIGFENRNWANGSNVG